MSSKGRERLAPDVRAAQIVEVAAQHFARDGVAGASTIAIARDAGVTRALVYHYFPGREALLAAVLHREADQLLAATEPDPALEVGANLRRALTAYLDAFAASRGALRELYTPASAVPTVRELARANHLIHMQWLLEQTGLPDTTQARLCDWWLAGVRRIRRPPERRLPRRPTRRCGRPVRRGARGCPRPTARPPRSTRRAAHLTNQS